MRLVMLLAAVDAFLRGRVRNASMGGGRQVERFVSDVEMMRPCWWSFGLCVMANWRACWRRAGLRVTLCSCLNWVANVGAVSSRSCWCMEEGSREMFWMWEVISEAGPWRREGLADRDRERRMDLDVAEPVLCLFVSGSECRDSSMGLRLGLHLWASWSVAPGGDCLWRVPVLGRLSGCLCRVVVVVLSEVVAEW